MARCGPLLRRMSWAAGKAACRRNRPETHHRHPIAFTRATHHYVRYVVYYRGVSSAGCDRVAITVAPVGVAPVPGCVGDVCVLVCQSAWRADQCMGK